MRGACCHAFLQAAGSARSRRGSPPPWAWSGSTPRRCGPRRPTSPPRAAASRPTPTMAPVIVCVVETGMPGERRAEQRERARGLGAEAADRLQLGDAACPSSRRCASRRTSCRAPIAPWLASTTQSGTWNSPVRWPGRVEQRGDDAHRLLRVVAAVPEAERRRRDQLQPPEQLVDDARRGAPEDPQTRATC